MGVRKGHARPCGLSPILYYPLSSSPPSARWSLRGKPAMLVPLAVAPTGMPPAFAQGATAWGPTTPSG